MLQETSGGLNRLIFAVTGYHGDLYGKSGLERNVIGQVERCQRRPLGVTPPSRPQDIRHTATDFILIAPYEG